MALPLNPCAVAKLILKFGAVAALNTQLHPAPLFSATCSRTCCVERWMIPITTLFRSRRARQASKSLCYAAYSLVYHVKKGVCLMSLRSSGYNFAAALGQACREGWAAAKHTICFLFSNLMISVRRSISSPPFPSLSILSNVCLKPFYRMRGSARRPELSSLKRPGSPSP